MNITARTTRHTRTAVAAVAAGALTCLALGLSGGTATAEDAGRVDIGYAKHGVEAPEPADIGRLLNDIDTPVGPAEQAPAPSEAPATVLVDDDSLEVLQVALGALGGVALVAIGIVVSRGRPAKPLLSTGSRPRH